MQYSELAGWLPRVEEELARSYLEEGRRSPDFQAYTTLLQEFSTRGGKRLRALLVLAGYHLATGGDPAPALPAAAAMEHFQDWMLIHDDIIDHAETRRGGPAVHLLLEREHVRLHRSGSKAEYGIGMGITLGDLEEPYTIRAFLASDAPPDRRVAALSEYVRMTADTAYGQLLDIRLSGLPIAKVEEEDVLTVHRLKSAIYSVASPLRIGALLGGGSSELLDLLEAAGIGIGIAFQLRDDVIGAGLGSSGAEKSANDLAEGKRTLLLVRAWRLSAPAERRALEREIARARRSVRAVRALQKRIRSTGSLAHSERLIEQLSARALQAVQSSAAIDAAGRRLLSELADRLVRRSR
ncbi:MAG TPA: polyprenyl synthetase family protein [Thermoplasmata archaeon]|nr:polyprenyl synthetase family protein [Thermoplasmata archaeon]